MRRVSILFFLLLGLLLPSSAGAAQAPDLLASLSVRTENNADYSRDRFKHWIDADKNSCDTRQEVLLRQNKATNKKCKDASGSWYSAYDGLSITTASSLDIDHMVALAEAWGSGARSWDDAKRERFANDLYGYSLLAVSASSNRSKGDRDPAEWLPPLSSYRCRYLATWVAVKYRWRLTVNFVEKVAIKTGLLGCSKTSMEVTKITRAS